MPRWKSCHGSNIVFCIFQAENIYNDEEPEAQAGELEAQTS